MGQEQLVKPECQEVPEQLVLLEHRVALDSQETEARLARSEQQDHRDKLVQLAIRDLQD